MDLFDYIVQANDLARLGTIKDLDEATICEILRQILCGVEATHKSGLAHYDLKLDQILVSMDYKIKITDFGLAKPLILDGEK